MRDPPPAFAVDHRSSCLLLAAAAPPESEKFQISIATFYLFRAALWSSTRRSPSFPTRSYQRRVVCLLEPERSRVPQLGALEWCEWPDHPVEHSPSRGGVSLQSCESGSAFQRRSAQPAQPIHPFLPQATHPKALADRHKTR